MLNELRAFLPMVEKVKARNPTMPILNHLCIQNETMRISDIETTVVIPVDDKRSYTLPVNILKQIFKQKPQKILISLLEDDRIEIMFDLNSVVFESKDPEEYPCIPNEKFKKVGIWTREIFLQLYKQLEFVSNDELKPALNGVWVNQNSNIQTCATDGHTLEFIENLEKENEHCKITAKFTGIIPAKVIRIMARFFRCNVSVYRSEHFIKFELPNKIKVFSRLIDDQYPDMEEILKFKNSNKVSIKRENLLKAISASRPFTNPDSKLGVLSIQDGTIAVNTQDFERNIEFETHISTIERKGKELRIGFNMDLLEKVIKDINGDEISWHYENPISASIFRSSQDSNKTHVLMPIRIEVKEDG